VSGGRYSDAVSESSRAPGAKRTNRRRGRTTSGPRLRVTEKSATGFIEAVEERELNTGRPPRSKNCSSRETLNVHHNRENVRKNNGQGVSSFVRDRNVDNSGRRLKPFRNSVIRRRALKNVECRRTNERTGGRM